MDRASLEEVLEFANKVRAAGGANPLDALMPATPGDATQCLIARNLNFSCEVCGGAPPEGDYWDSIMYDSGRTAWFMYVDDRATLDRIATALGIEVEYVRRGALPSANRLVPAIRLPESIGEVARAFDMWVYEPEKYSEFTPYVEESFKEEHRDLVAG